MHDFRGEFSLILSFSHSSTFSPSNVYADFTLADTSRFDNVFWRKFMSLRTIGSLRCPYMVMVCISMWKNSKACCMKHILADSYVFKVFNSIVCLYGIFVIYLKFLWLWADKSFSNETMNKVVMPPDQYSQVAMRMKIWFADASGEGISIIRVPSDSSEAGHRIRPIKNRSPLFVFKFLFGKLYGRLFGRHLNPPYQGSMFRPVGKPTFLYWPLLFIQQTQTEVKGFL